MKEIIFSDKQILIYFVVEKGWGGGRMKMEKQISRISIIAEFYLVKRLEFLIFPRTIWQISLTIIFALEMVTQQ